MKEQEIWYLCDGNVPECKKTKCYKQVGKNGCRHTSDIKHAANFLIREKHGEIIIREVPAEDWIEKQNRKITHYLWIIFVSMFTAILTTLSITPIMLWHRNKNGS